MNDFIIVKNLFWGEVKWEPPLEINWEHCEWMNELETDVKEKTKRHAFVWFETRV